MSCLERSPLRLHDATERWVNVLNMAETAQKVFEGHEEDAIVRRSLVPVRPARPVTRRRATTASHLSEGHLDVRPLVPHRILIRPGPLPLALLPVATAAAAAVRVAQLHELDARRDAVPKHSVRVSVNEPHLLLCPTACDGGAALEEELEEVMACSGLEERLTHLLGHMTLNPLEWQQYAAWDPNHFTRILLASSPLYSIALSCWDRGQFSPPHDHAGSRNWIKVLSGNIQEVQYEPREREPPTVWPPAVSGSATGQGLGVSRAGQLAADTVTFLAPSTVHSCLNDQDERAFTLHLYSPPYTRAHFYDVASGGATPIDIPLFNEELTK